MERRLENGWIFRIDDKHAAGEVMIIVPNPAGGFIREPFPRHQWDAVVADMALPGQNGAVNDAEGLLMTKEDARKLLGLPTVTLASSTVGVAHEADSDALQPAPEPVADEAVEEPKRKPGRPRKEQVIADG